MARAQAQASGLEGKELGKHQHKLLIAVGKERARQCASLRYPNSCRPITRHTSLHCAQTWCAMIYACRHMIDSVCRHYFSAMRYA